MINKTSNKTDATRLRVIALCYKVQQVDLRSSATLREAFKIMRADPVLASRDDDDLTFIYTRAWNAAEKI